MDTQHIKVLLIEDNPGDARLIEEMLARAGGVTFDMECSDRLSKGLSRIQKGGIDVILLDLSLPDSQGLDTFTEVHTHSPVVPIVVLSGLSDEELAVKAVQEGAQDYLVKSNVDIDLLVRSIRYAIERKHAEEELVRLSTVVKITPDAVMISDLDGNIMEVNKAALKMHGTDNRDDLIGKNLFEIIVPEEQGKTFDCVQELLEKGCTKNQEYHIITKDERVIPAEMSTSLMKSGNGEPVGFVGIIRDITERKRAEEQLIQSEKLAGIGTLASGIAHEINNPLAGIMGYAEILQSEEDPEMRRRYSQKIVDNVLRASNIVKWLSKFSRRAREGNITDVDLKEVINDSLEALKHTRKSYDINVTTDYQTIPNMLGNRSELQQVFVNLLNNAVDALHNGGSINLSTTMNYGLIEVKVSDNGAGIPKEQINRIFEPFYTMKEVGGGTGLGLYVTSMIVKKHQGTIDVDSEVGSGTTFTLRFPISEVET